MKRVDAFWTFKHCSQHQVPTLFVRYRHNQFNIFFLWAQYVYFYRERIVDFLKEKHGATNRLFIFSFEHHSLWCASAFVQCRLSSTWTKFEIITAPLWRLIEQDSHILDMNMHYLELYTFLNEQSKFMKGSSPLAPYCMLDSDKRFWRLCASRIYCTNSVHKHKGVVRETTKGLVTRRKVC